VLSLQAIFKAPNAAKQLDHPVEWAMIQGNLAVTHVRIAQQFDGSFQKPLLREALPYVEAALTVYDEVYMRPKHIEFSNLRDQILTALFTLKG
jgi:hypothetical protein